MKTEKLYIASLRVVINRRPINSYMSNIKHSHLKLVLVKCNNLNKGVFKDIETGEKYMDITKGFRNIGIALYLIETFNSMTKNTEKNLPKQKVLSLYGDVKTKYIEHKRTSREK